MRSKLKLDLNDSRITDICDKIYFLHKAETEIADMYIEYEIIGKKYTSYASNKNLNEDYTIQVDIFSKGNYSKLESALIEVLEEKGYYFLDSADLYEPDTALYHSATRWRYTKFK